MKYLNQYTKVAGLFLAALAFGACSDKWDDHYDYAGNNGGTNGSLWEAISSDSQLSNFAKVAKALGYESSLDGHQVFTVFAPTNDSFTEAEADALIAQYAQDTAKHVVKKDIQAVKEFLQNHIALYNYSVPKTGNTESQIIMMNGKYQTLSPTTFAGKELLDKNILTNNGVLFTIKEKADYVPNIFEYLGKDATLDSIAAFLYSYNVYEFDPDQSVPGEIVDGKTVYLDSVSVLKNEIVDDLGDINVEDSAYWMVVPNNQEWDRLLPQYTSYFNYDDKVADRDSLTRLYSHLNLFDGSVFSLGENTEQSLQDSAYSVKAVGYNYRETVYGFADADYYVYSKPKPFEPGGVFADAEKVECSNGVVLKVPSWNIKPTQTFMRKIQIEAEAARYRKEYDEDNTQAPKEVDVSADNKEFYNKVSGNKFIELSPLNDLVTPTIVYNIPNLLSNVPYDIKVVMVPALAGDTLATARQRRKVRIGAVLDYNDQSGKPVSESSQAITLQRNLEAEKDVIDTLLIGENVIIPTCSYGIDPHTNLTITSYRVRSSETEDYQTTLRIDCIIFEPKYEN